MAIHTGPKDARPIDPQEGDDSGSGMSAIVLAGKRVDGDPVAEQAGVPTKALVQVGGRPMIERVVSALTDSHHVRDIAVSGLPENVVGGSEVGRMLQSSGVQFIEARNSPSLSVAHALDVIPPVRRVLLTTADHALLTADTVDRFVGRATDTSADIVIGVTRLEDILRIAPESRRTVMRFSDGRFCGCNLFAFLTPAGRDAMAFWRRVESHRKNPYRVARELGVMTLIRYVMGRLRLDQAMQRLSDRCGARVQAVVLEDGTAAIDVDKPDDLLLAERLDKARREGQVRK